MFLQVGKSKQDFPVGLVKEGSRGDCEIDGKNGQDTRGKK